MFVIIIEFIESPVTENVSNSVIFKPLGYNKKEDGCMKNNKDFKSNSLSRSQYNKVREFQN